MSIRDDAVFLAGFITGTYDLKGEALPPKCVQQVIERIMVSEADRPAPAPDSPRAAPQIQSDETVISSNRDQVVERIKEIVGIATEDDEESTTDEPPSSGEPQTGKKERKKMDLSPEESERRRRRMQEMWARKRQERDVHSSIPAVTSIVVSDSGRDKRGNP